jgi:hypothetical protein
MEEALNVLIGNCKNERQQLALHVFDIYIYIYIYIYNWSFDVFFFVECLLEDGRRRTKHVVGLPHACVSQ